MSPSIGSCHIFITTSCLDCLEEYGQVDRSIINNWILIKRKSTCLHNMGKAFHEMLWVHHRHGSALRAHASGRHLPVRHARHWLFSHHSPAHALRLHLSLHLHITLELLLKSHLISCHLLLLGDALWPLLLLALLWLL